MSDPRAVKIATDLHILGVSQTGIVELLTQYPFDRIEKQLLYLPFRKAKRPEALIIDAIRNNYAPPKEYFYAKAETADPEPQTFVDQGSEHPNGQAPSHVEGHRTEDSPPTAPADEWLQSGGPGCDLALPPAD